MYVCTMYVWPYVYPDHELGVKTTHNKTRTKSYGSKRPITPYGITAGAVLTRGISVRSRFLERSRSPARQPTRCRCPRRQDYVFEPNYQRIRHVRAVDFSHADHPIRLERLMQVEMSRDAHGGTVIGRLEIALAMLSTLR